ncbi:hypothetical protein FCJ51_26620 [Pseudomonas sp. UMC3106]|nr:hypothetical protein [Pseudomonas sp. UMC3106]
MVRQLVGRAEPRLNRPGGGGGGAAPPPPPPPPPPRGGAPPPPPPPRPIPAQTARHRYLISR